MAALFHHKQLRVTELSQIFAHTTNSYKFYWFWALLEQAQKKETIKFRDLLIQMVTLSWHTVVYYKLSFGSSDQLPEIMKRMLAIGEVHELSKQKDIEDYLHACWSGKDASEAEKQLITAVNNLQNEVPYRSLRPFIKGTYSKSRTIDYSNRHFGVAEEAPLYRINDDTVNSLTIPPEWRAYLQQHHKILLEFCWWNLAKFLRRRNPNVPNVSAKIFSPHSQTRNTSAARKFWNMVLQPQLPPLYCWYTQQPLHLQAKWSIDHFVPWSFVHHDQLWNLSPQLQFLNSSKSNKLPHRDYWKPFAELQYQAVQRFIQQKPTSKDLKLLEDYNLLYKKPVEELTQEKFVKGLLDTLKPLMQQAQNLGFKRGWPST